MRLARRSLLALQIFTWVVVACGPVISPSNPPGTPRTPDMLSSGTTVPVSTDAAFNVGTDTPTPADQGPVVGSCAAPPESGIDLPGVIGLARAWKNGDDGSVRNNRQEGFLIGGTPIQKRVLLGDMTGVQPIGFSPDEQTFAFLSEGESDTDPQELHLLKPDGGERVVIPEQLTTSEYWPVIGSWAFARWINNSLLIVMVWYPELTEGPRYPYSLGIFDPFGEMWDQDILQGLPNWDASTVPFISPDLTRAVYVASREGGIGTDLVLWDLSRNRELTRREDYPAGMLISGVRAYGLSNVAAWSPDSSSFFYPDFLGNPGDSELVTHVIDREGSARHTIGPDPSIGGPVGIGDWSADARYIAYMNSPTNLAIYDVSERKLHLVCENLEDPVGTSWRLEVLWSPDSAFVAYAPIYDGQRFLEVLEVTTGRRFRVVEVNAFFPAGWVSDLRWLDPPSGDT